MTDPRAHPSPVSEETGYIPSGAGQLYGLLLESEAAIDEGKAVVLLAPLAGERKSSLKALVEVARALAAAGLIVLRIDYRGTGDSSGKSEDLSIESMVEDAVAAARHLRREYGCRGVSLAGLRLGGAVALLAAERAGAEALALVEPVVTGAAYVRELERQQSIRRMLTKGRGPAE